MARPTVSDLQTVYTVLLIVGLGLNGLGVGARHDLAELRAPQRDRRTLAVALGFDLLVVPVLLLGTAWLLDVDAATWTGLVLAAACSAGAIGVALARLGRGDVPLAVALVTGLGLLNLLTIPVVTGLLLPSSLTLPLEELLYSLLGLLVLPLLAGRALARWRGFAQRPEPERERLIARILGLADVSLLAAISVAVLLDPRAMGAALIGPVPVTGLAVMVGTAVILRSIGMAGAQRRTLLLVTNARAMGLALTLAALHLPGEPVIRGTLLAVGGLTQGLPVLVLLAARGLRPLRGRRSPAPDPAPPAPTA